MRKSCRIALRAACCGLALFALGCAQQQPATDTRAADEAAIREADIAFSKAAAAKQLDAAVVNYAEEASLLLSNTPIATDKEAIRKAWEQMLQAPGFSISWQPAKADVARSGDLGYSQGTYELTTNDPKGNPVMDRGKYVKIGRASCRERV